MFLVTRIQTQNQNHKEFTIKPLDYEHLFITESSHDPKTPIAPETVDSGTSARGWRSLYCYRKWKPIDRYENIWLLRQRTSVRPSKLPYGLGRERSFELILFDYPADQR